MFLDNGYDLGHTSWGVYVPLRALFLVIKFFHSDTSTNVCRNPVVVLLKDGQTFLQVQVSAIPHDDCVYKNLVCRSCKIMPFLCKMFYVWSGSTQFAFPSPYFGQVSQRIISLFDF